MDKPSRRKSPQEFPHNQQKYEFRLDLVNLRQGIDTANNIMTYNRWNLHNIYRRVIRDPNLISQWNTRILKTLDREFKVVKGGKEDAELTSVFEAPWFNHFVRLALEHQLWGFTLIEFGPWDSEKMSFQPYKDTTGLYHDALEAVDRDWETK